MGGFGRIDFRSHVDSCSRDCEEASVPRTVEDRRGLESSGSCCVTATARYVDYSFSSCAVASARDNIIVASTSAPDSYISASRLLLMSVLFLLLFPRFLRLSLRLCLVWCNAESKRRRYLHLCNISVQKNRACLTGKQSYDRVYKLLTTSSIVWKANFYFFVYNILLTVKSGIAAKFRRSNPCYCRILGIAVFFDRTWRHDALFNRERQINPNL